MPEFSLQSRLMVLKAHLLSREVMNSVQNQGAALSSDTCALAKHARMQLEAQEPTEERLRRRMFYALVEAECLRRFNPGKHRRVAQECGELLASNYGAEDPYPLFLVLVEATTGVTNRAVEADMTAHSSSAVPSDMIEVTDRFGNVLDASSRPAVAVGLTKRDLSDHASFLFEYSIADILKRHGIRG